MRSLGDVSVLLVEYLWRSTSASETTALRTASGAAAYLSCSGQIYRFEDSLQKAPSSPFQAQSHPEVHSLLQALASRSSSAAERETLHVAIRALAYIEASGQEEPFKDFLTYWMGDSIPYVIAAFETHAEAKAWVEAQSDPPRKASILIGGEYHEVVARRERREPLFFAFPLIAEFLERVLETGLPRATAAFQTREEASSWLAHHPDPPRQAFITIGGEYHLAACWRNIPHRALYPLTIVAELQRARRELEEQSALLEKARREWELQGAKEEPEDELEAWDTQEPN